LRRRSGNSSYIILAALVLTSAAAGLVLDWTSFGLEFDKYAYDYLFRLEQPKPWQPGSIILAIDERTLARFGGMSHVRASLADGLEKIRAAKPAAVAIDLILAEPGISEEEDTRLESAFAATPNLVLACYLLTDNSWEEPIPRFRKHAFALGHVHADFDKYDSVSRDVPLEKVGGRQRRWALALEMFRAVRGGTIIESPDDLMVGSVRIPSSIRDGRVMRIRYVPVAMGALPRVSIAELDAHPELAERFRGQAVFAGVTAQAAGDRWATPYSNSVAMPGIEMNANEYETLARQKFLVDAPVVSVAAVCFALAAGAGLIYAFLGGRVANLLALLAVFVSQLIPVLAFSRQTVWPWLPGTLAVLMAIAASASWRHLLVRRALLRAGHEKNRYQKAMQFVTHEMRTPLTAIQGSSELISRYSSMPEAKRRQMAELINSESKRLARMIETFLSAERLSAGEMDLKQERFSLAELVESCTGRARPLADRKQIVIEIETLPQAELTGDRELMEYAVYNLLTNAVKYSPSATTIRVFGEDDRRGGLRLSIKDEGIGMDKKEVGRIFEKFYRTRRAELSGEVGTGIGLSIVEQIVTQHGGTIHVESEPGKGSRFTLSLKSS
jgi:signal transduction histidine kinase